MSLKRTFHNFVYKLIFLSTLILSLCGLSSCTTLEHVDTSKVHQSRQDFETFLEDQFRASFEDELLNLHYTLKDPQSFGIEKPEKAFSSITPDYAARMKTDLEKTQNTLRQIKKSHLTEEQQRIYQTLNKYLTQQIALCDYPEFINLLSYGTGLSSNLPLTLAEYAFYTEEDVLDYLSILPAIPALLTDAYEWEKTQTAKGYGMSAFEIDHVIEQIDSFLGENDKKQNPDTLHENLLIETFASRLDALSGLSQDQKSIYAANNKNLVLKTVLPAFAGLKQDLLTLKKDAPEGKGLSHYENGKEYYELLLASMTLSDRSLSTMINSLEKRLDTIQDRITDVVLETPDIYDIYLEILEKNNLPAQTPKEMLLCLEEKIKMDYPELSDVTYKAEPIPKPLENDTTAAYYLIPPYDSPEENRIYYGSAATDNCSLFMTLSHEGYPGHLYHQNYLLEHNLSPIFYILDMTGYKEGWAFYAEIDAADYYDFGEYEEAYHDELTELYRCNLEYSYLISSLTDLYVNGKGYEKERIHAFITSLGMDEETASSLYQYAIEEPGTYLQYYIGYLEILTIRDAAEKRAGSNFNKKDFHEAFLSFGPCFYGDLAKYMKQEY